MMYGWPLGLYCQCQHEIISSVTSNCSSTSLSVSPMSSSLTSSSPPVPGAGNMTNNMTRSNTKSVLVNDDRLTLETLNQFKNGAHTIKLDKVGHGPVKSMGRTPKKRTHTATSSLTKVINIETEDQDQEQKAVKIEDSESELNNFVNFGATLNPTSRLAREMSTMPQVM